MTAAKGGQSQSIVVAPDGAERQTADLRFSYGPFGLNFVFIALDIGGAGAVVPSERGAHAPI